MFGLFFSSSPPCCYSWLTGIINWGWFVLEIWVPESECFSIREFREFWVVCHLPVFSVCPWRGSARLRARLYAADDTGRRRRRRVAGHRARAVERLQPRGLRHALLPLHRRHGHSPLPQGPSVRPSMLFVSRSCPVCINWCPFLHSLTRHDVIGQVLIRHGSTESCWLLSLFLIRWPNLFFFLVLGQITNVTEDPGPWPSREKSSHKNTEAALLGHPVARLFCCIIRLCFESWMCSASL